jgi:hypothetical protein
MVLHLRQPAPGNGWQSPLAKCVRAVHANPDGSVTDPFFEGAEGEAVEFCRRNGECPLLRACLSFALVNNEKSGVWGGTGELDRRAIRKQWPLHRGREPRPEWDLFEPGEPASWYAVEELIVDDEEDDDDDPEEA